MQMNIHIPFDFHKIKEIQNVIVILCFLLMPDRQGFKIIFFTASGLLHNPGSLKMHHIDTLTISIQKFSFIFYSS